MISALHAVNNDLFCDIFRDNYKKREQGGQIKLTSSPPTVSLVTPDLPSASTKKRSGVNRRLLLDVYVSHTGCSKIGLVLACQLHAQRQPVPLRQALFGPPLVRNHRRRRVLRVWDGQQWRDEAPECQHSELRGRFRFLWCFHSMWSTKKKKKKTNNNMMWLRRFCTRRLPICACLSPFLHIRPFSDVLLNTNSIYVKVVWQQS